MYSNTYYELMKGISVKVAWSLAAKWSMSFSVRAIAQFSVPYTYRYGSNLPQRKK